MAALFDGFEIDVLANTSPLIIFQLTKGRDESQQGALQDITGYAFRLTVTRYRFDENGERQLHTFFSLDGVIVAASKGTVSFQFTAAAHTNLPPGEYDAEIVWESTGDLDAPPTDGVQGVFRVRDRRKSP